MTQNVPDFTQLEYDEVKRHIRQRAMELSEEPCHQEIINCHLLRYKLYAARIALKSPSECFDLINQAVFTYLSICDTGVVGIPPRLGTHDLMGKQLLQGYNNAFDASFGDDTLNKKLHNLLLEAELYAEEALGLL